MHSSHSHSADPDTTVRASTPSIGDIVELRQQGITLRVGEVESAMHDGSGFWLAAHGPDTRLYVPVPTAEDSIEIRITSLLRPWPGTSTRNA